MADPGYAYQSQQASLFRPYYQRWLWDRVLRALPPTVSPNAMTLIGSLCCAISFVLAATFNRSPLALGAAALLILVYLSLDNLDGRAGATPRTELAPRGVPRPLARHPEQRLRVRRGVPGGRAAQPAHAHGRDQRHPRLLRRGNGSCARPGCSAWGTSRTSRATRPSRCSTSPSRPSGPTPFTRRSQ